jgi:hypothetical protein
VTNLLKIAGFNKFTYWQTIFTLPADIKSVHEAQKGFGRGGFVVIAARNK